MLNQQGSALPFGLSRHRFGASRFLVTFVVLGLLLALYYTSGVRDVSFSRNWRSHSSDITAVRPIHTQSRFINWLKDRVPKHRTPFVTIGDCQYIHALRNFKHRLDKWGYGNDLVVICLDQCCADATEYHSYTRFIGESIAHIKFSVNLELTATGYNFVFFDGDVYLTGGDPFKSMLPLSDDTWDVQFQVDHDAIKDWNIGWYFAKATAQTHQFFTRSYARWNETKAWDQYVMWEIGHAMETEEASLRVNVLNQTVFTNFMTFGLEYPFSSPVVTKKIVQESTLIHFTCIEQSLKTYFGYYFGGFGDMDNYYSDPPPLIGMANASGFIDTIHAQVAFAAALSRKVHRTFMWPDTVDITQKRKNETGPMIAITRQERQSGIRAISWDSAQKAKLPTVEGNYLANLKRNGHKELEIVSMDARTPIPALEEAIMKLSDTQVAILDFANFTPPVVLVLDETPVALVSNATYVPQETATWLERGEQRWLNETFDKGGYRAYSQVYLDKLKKCPRADWPTACLGACDLVPPMINSL